MGEAHRPPRLLVLAVPARALPHGLEEGPQAAPEGAAGPEEALRARTRERFGIEIEVREPLGTFNHSITRHRIRAACFRALLSGNPGGDRARLASPEEIEGLGTSSFAMKALRLGLG